MEKQEHILEAIVFAISALSSEKKLSQKMDLMLEALVGTIKADRAYIYKNIENADKSKSMHYLHEWCNKDVKPYINQGVIDTLNWNDFPDLFSRLSKKETINETVAASPNLHFRDTMELQGILAYLFIPIFSGDLFWGYLGLDNSESTFIFSDKEVIAMTTVTMALGNSILAKKKSKKLKKARKKYLSDLNAISNVMFNLDLDYRFIFLNDHWEEFSGYKISDALGKRINSFLVNEDELDEKFNQVGIIGIKKTITTEVSFIREDGSTIYAKLKLSKVLNEKNKLIRIVGSLVDITTQKESLELNSKLNLVLLAVNETHINTLQEEKSIDSLNYLLKILLSITKSQFGFIGEVQYDHSNPYLQVKIVNNIHDSEKNKKAKTVKHKEGMEFRNLDSLIGATLTTKDIIISNDPEKNSRSEDFPEGSPPIKNFIGIPIKKDGIMLGMMGFANKTTGYALSDVTVLIPVLAAYANMIQGLRVLQDKQKMEEQYRLISENTLDIITIQDENLNYKFVSPSIENKFGFRPDELIGKKPADIFGSFDQKALASDGISKTIMKLPTKDGSNYLMIESITQPMLDEFKNITGYLVTGRDVTERELLLDQLKESLTKEKDLSHLKSKFISMASHEFRTPLATILSSGEIITFITVGNIDEEAKKKIISHVDRISIQTKRLVNIISDILLLETNSNSSRKLEIDSINFLGFFAELINEYFFDQKEDKQIVIKVPKRDFILKSNTTLLTHILKNLIENALKYSDYTSNSVEVNITQYKKEFVVQVKDYGIGIPKQDQKYVFNSFYRGKNISNIKGTGLGLNIVKEFSAKLGVTIAIESEENKGTTISVKIPYDNKDNSN